MTAQDKIQEFKKELSELLLKYNAELITENRGDPYIGSHEIFVNFEWDDELFKKFEFNQFETDVVSQLCLSDIFNGKN